MKPKASRERKRPVRNRRRRGRELALQALFEIDHQSTRQGVSPVEARESTMARLRERALAAELECRIADGDKAAARELVAALAAVAPDHALAIEARAWLGGEGPIPLPPTDDERAELEALRGSVDALEFCRRIVDGVAGDLAEIDQLLGACSTNWRVARMAVVDRNILRMGTFEMKHLTDIPPRVTLNEAIEIGKRYGTSESGAFINGILDKIATRLGHVRGRAGDDAGTTGVR